HRAGPHTSSANAPAGDWFQLVGTFLQRPRWLGEGSERLREGLVSTSQAVAQHLPYLRRYARALTGSQNSGDAYVAATLEALIEDPSVLDQGASTRVALYKLFTKIWNSVPVNGSAEAGADEMPVEHRLSNITPKPGQAFLLVAVEGLSDDDDEKVV